MSVNEKFPGKQSDRSHHVARVETTQVAQASSEVTSPEMAPPQVAIPEVSNAGSERLPTMSDLDSLAESLDQVDQTLADLDQAPI